MGSSYYATNSSSRGDGLYVVTGAFGYSGKYITSRLLAAGRRVRTLTNSLQRQNPFGPAVEAHPYNFDKPDLLAQSLEGAEVLINTYWVRFDHRDFTHRQAVRNTASLFDAAGRAGVRRVVHVSITNPSAESALPYFRGKAELESALRESGLSYAILRPAVLFGREDILINNIAWMLRRFPLFGMFGDGSYKLQPIFVDDLARLAVEASGSSENLVRDAVGLVVGDVVVTPAEVAGLMQNLLVTSSPPAGNTALSQWIVENKEGLGRRYSSELARRRDRQRTYEQLRTSA